MKKFARVLSALIAPALLASVFLFHSTPARAVGTAVPDYLYNTCVTSVTIQTVWVSTTAIGGNLNTAGIAGAQGNWNIQMDTPTMTGRAYLWVENNDPANNLWCNTNPALLKAGGGLGTGFEVASASSTNVPSFVQFPLASNAYTGSTYQASSAIHVYCVTDRATNASTATVVQCY